MTERQDIQITSTVVKETQVVSFSNWVQQSDSVNSEWDVGFQCNDGADCIGQYFELSLFGASTGKITLLVYT